MYTQVNSRKAVQKGPSEADAPDEGGAGIACEGTRHSEAICGVAGREAVAAACIAFYGADLCSEARVVGRAQTTEGGFEEPLEMKSDSPAATIVSKIGRHACWP